MQKKFTKAEAKIIGDKLSVDWNAFDVKQFQLGLNTEFAVGIYSPITNFPIEDPIEVGKTVRTNLNERPDYYTYWVQIQKNEG